MGVEYGENAVDYDTDHSGNVIREVNEATGIERKYTEVMVNVFAHGATGTTGDDKAHLPISPGLAGMKLVNVRTKCDTPGGGDPVATTNVMIHKEHEGADQDILSTGITHGNEYGCQDGVINATYQVMVLDDLLCVDVDAWRTGMTGLWVTFCFKPVTPA